MRRASVSPSRHLPEIARRSAPGDDPAERAADIGRGAQHVAQIGAQQRILVQPVDEIEPRLDAVPGRERCGEVLGQQPRACAGDAAVDLGKQAAGTAAAPRTALGREDFEARPRRLVHRQHRVAGAGDGRQQQRQGAAPDVVEIADQPAGGGEHRAREAAESVERGDRMHGLEPRLAFVAGEVAQRPGDGLGRRAGPAFGRDEFTRTEPCERGTQRLRARIPRAPSARSKCRRRRGRTCRARRTPQRARWPGAARAAPPRSRSRR